MKINKFALVPLLLSSAYAASLTYHLREKIDPSIIAADCGKPDPHFENGIVEVRNDNIRILFMGNEPAIVDHMYNMVGTSGEKKLTVRDSDQHVLFMKTLEEKLETFRHDRARLYAHTLQALEDWNTEKEKKKEKAKGISSIFNTVFGRKNETESTAAEETVEENRLKQVYEERLHELEMTDKKILKMEKILEYCHNKGCLAIRKRRSFVENLPDFHWPNLMHSKNVIDNPRT